MFLCDDGGGLEIEAINVLSYGTNPYTELFQEEDGYVWLRNIPIDRFRVLKLNYVGDIKQGIQEELYSE